MNLSFSDLQVDVQLIKSKIQDCVTALDNLDVTKDEKLDLVELNKLLDQNTKKMKRIKEQIKKMNRVKISLVAEYETLFMENKKIMKVLENKKREMKVVIAVGVKVSKTMSPEDEKK